MICKDWRDPRDCLATGAESVDGRGLLFSILSFSNPFAAGAAAVSSCSCAVGANASCFLVSSTLTLGTASFSFAFPSSTLFAAASLSSFPSAAAVLSILGLGLALSIEGVPALEGGVEVGVCALFRDAAAFTATALASRSCNLLFELGVADLGGVGAMCRSEERRVGKECPV